MLETVAGKNQWRSYLPSLFVVLRGLELAEYRYLGLTLGTELRTLLTCGWTLLYTVTKLERLILTQSTLVGSRHGVRKSRSKQCRTHIDAVAGFAVRQAAIFSLPN